ncbi:MAG: N-acetyltransferase [Alphaproteobacteria bacterium]|nr:N-acetyltransferase [Alphaproteobacteria bacterium]MBQ7949652.1 N-acetyltransferase [Alphaproteobacteria bacterium]MBR2342599.1 N-acetyltransferase [Alphaproteobacteria bacterium]
MPDEVQFSVALDGSGINAIFQGQKIGEITYVRVGMDKLIIDYTTVDSPFRGQQIGLALVRSAVRMAREQKRKVITLCPFARAMFNRYPEFDDVRLMNSH